MRNLDDVTRDLASVTDALLAVEATDFARRHELLKRQDQLRAEADAFASGFEKQRPTQDILSELESLRQQRDAEVKGRIGRTMMSGPGGTRGAPGAVSGEMMRLTTKANANGRLEALTQRIAALESLLAEQGLDPHTPSQPTASEQPPLEPAGP